MNPARLIFLFLSLMLSAAIFGFFYAWVTSTMWGLDAADPRVAIAAMQAMNASVRNMAFAPAFFATPFVMLIAAALWWPVQRPAALALAAGGLVYLFGGMVLTLVVNVPMNEALALISVPSTATEAAVIWADYSPRWQMFNLIRTVMSSASVLCCGVAIWLAARRTA